LPPWTADGAMFMVAISILWRDPLNQRWGQGAERTSDGDIGEPASAAGQQVTCSDLDPLGRPYCPLRGAMSASGQDLKEVDGVNRLELGRLGRLQQLEGRAYAFDNLLGLLDPRFEGLSERPEGQRRKHPRDALGNDMAHLGAPCRPVWFAPRGEPVFGSLPDWFSLSPAGPASDGRRPRPGQGRTPAGAGGDQLRLPHANPSLVKPAYLAVVLELLVDWSNRVDFFANTGGSRAQSARTTLGAASTARATAWGGRESWRSAAVPQKAPTASCGRPRSRSFRSCA